MACGCSGSASSSNALADNVSDAVADNVTIDVGAALLGAAAGAGVSYLANKDINLLYVGIGALINGVFLKVTF